MRFFSHRQRPTVHEEVYLHVERTGMILRDHLAIDRTNLSNQNTFLAYIRTALTLFIAGLSFIKFFDSEIVFWIGWAFIPIGIMTFLVGLLRYNRTRVLLQHIWKTKRQGKIKP